ncbi:hypothetical protein BDQ12DRAFT_727460 [Crucibulum laeve]|uniref:F-box domain-containing protein n=1 Tax=Crucibulum laeve TaxID=68775 RepID=A0A5C3LNH7_9AGAR|nr:hypothetical protein BDQ12DRAFT_727460 [Crucibulum laeve]
MSIVNLHPTGEQAPLFIIDNSCTAKLLKMDTPLRFPVTEEEVPLPPASSPFEEFLKSNDPPSQQDPILISDLIAQAACDLTRIDNMIKVQEILNTRRWEYVNFINNHRKLFSPLRRFPDELLTEIFTHYANYLMPIGAYAALYLLPWHLLIVCKRWREVAMSSPAH